MALNDEPTGIVQQIGERVRWGLEVFNLDEGGKVERRVGFNMNNMIVAIQNVNPATWTPLAEAFYEGVRYFQQLPPYYHRGDYVTNQTNDPYYYSNYKQYVRCCKSFILLITDGESTQDRNIPASLKDYDNDGRDPGGYSSNGSDYLDDVALWAHINDLRPDLDGKQTLTLYSVFAFGSGSQLLKDSAINGGFIDFNGDDLPGPDTKEWDADLDGVPDNYFEAQDGYQLEASLLTALTDILHRTSSGTSVSMLSTSGEGEGAMYQAFFYPSRLEGLKEVQWLGYLQGLFLDHMGNLREDSNENDRLDLNEDKIVRLVFDEDNGETQVERYSDNNGDGSPDSQDPEAVVSLNDIKPIWEAGKELALRSAATRQIYTWVDRNNDGQVADGEFVTFDSNQSSVLRPFLRAGDTLESQMIIDFIRGENMPGYRNRNLTVDGSQQVWKLGDIVSSTPVVIGSPKEQYDLIYKDASYQKFLLQYQNRRNVVYVGANDGMLHAFNAGFYDPNTRSFESGTGMILGEELWAYVPYEVLPHLKWLTLPEYTHVYYVDLTPKVTDVKIFSEDADHPGGWGTILMVGLRMGGGRMDVTDDFGEGNETRTFRSAYFALDVTNPDEPPTLLWSFTDPDMGFTASYPAVARVQGRSGEVSWLTIVGSGPTSYEGEKTLPNLFGTSNTTGNLYVLDLNTGDLLRKVTTDANSFMGDIITLDGNLDYTVDTVYAGSSYQSGNTWKGRLYRLVTNQYTDPGEWTFSTLFSADGPIVAAPAISVDSFSNIWVYAGTGRLISTSDKSSTASQFIVGVKDPCWFGGEESCPREVLSGSLMDVSAASVFGNASVDGVTGVSDFGELLENTRASGGWFLKFQDSGERVLAKPVILGGAMIFTTFIPDDDDVCAFQGKSKLYGVYFETGTSYTRSILEAGADQGGGEIKRSIDLGEGLPTKAGLHIGAEEGVKGYVQLGTGEITEIEAEPPFKFKSGVVMWQEKRR